MIVGLNTGSQGLPRYHFKVERYEVGSLNIPHGYTFQFFQKKRVDIFKKCEDRKPGPYVSSYILELPLHLFSPSDKFITEKFNMKSIALQSLALTGLATLAQGSGSGRPRSSGWPGLSSSTSCSTSTST